MTKRVNGEGSISFEAARNRWRAAISFVDDNGESKRKWYFGKTREEVANALKTALADQVRGVSPPVATDSVEAFLDTWMTHTVKPNTRPATVRNYTSLITHHINPAIGSIKLAQLKPNDIRRMLARMTARGLSPKTVACARTLLATALNQAVADGVLARSVIASVKPPRQPKANPEYFTPEQASALLAAVEGTDYADLWTLLLASGMRISEALGLRWSDIDFDHASISVSKQLTPAGGGAWNLSAPKSDSSVRSIGLIPQAAEALHHQRARILRYKAKFPKELQWPTHDLVFCGSKGQPLWANNARDALKRALKDANLPESLHPHSMRHTYASFNYAAGIQGRALQDLMGHATSAQTVAYTHVFRSVQAEATERLAAVFPTAAAV